jgi:3-hydroxyacyl-CoA dehydrogenase
MIPNPELALEKITYSTNYQLLKEVDLVIENITEKREIKKEVYQKQTMEIITQKCSTISLPIWFTYIH